MMTDDALADQLKLGNEKAFEALYERYSAPLMRHLICLMGNQQEAEDMLHESILLMVKKINFYTPNSELKNSFKAWLFRLSTNRAIDEIRKRKSPKYEAFENLQAETSLDSVEIYEAKEKEFVISDLLLKLPLIQRTVLSLRVLDDLSYMEIAIICGKDINAVKQGLFQARKNMKNLLVAQGEMI